MSKKKSIPSYDPKTLRAPKHVWDEALKNVMLKMSAEKAAKKAAECKSPTIEVKSNQVEETND